MIGALDAWRRELWTWALPLGFCLLNLLVLLAYRGALAGDVESLEERNQAAQEQLESFRQEGQQIDEFLDRFGHQEEAIESLYVDHFQTEGQRFTTAIREVKDLARKAGLDPRSFSYPTEELSDQKLIQRRINFSVGGTYRELRTFINFLELTDQFLSLDSVSLSEAGDGLKDPNLTIRLSISTVFSQPEVIEEIESRPGGETS